MHKPESLGSGWREHLGGGGGIEAVGETAEQDDLNTRVTKTLGLHKVWDARLLGVGGLLIPHQQS